MDFIVDAALPVAAHRYGLARRRRTWFYRRNRHSGGNGTRQVSLNELVSDQVPWRSTRLQDRCGTTVRPAPVVQLPGRTCYGSSIVPGNVAVPVGPRQARLGILIVGRQPGCRAAMRSERTVSRNRRLWTHRKSGKSSTPTTGCPPDPCAPGRSAVMIGGLDPTAFSRATWSRPTLRSPPIRNRRTRLQGHGRRPSGPVAPSQGQVRHDRPLRLARWKKQDRRVPRQYVVPRLEWEWNLGCCRYQLQLRRTR